MRLRYLWEAFTWIKKDGNGGNGIKNAMQGQLLGKPSQNPFVNALNENNFFWVILLGSDRQEQNMTILHPWRN